jgi:hypothetical protein
MLDRHNISLSYDLFVAAAGQVQDSAGTGERGAVVIIVVVGDHSNRLPASAAAAPDAGTIRKFLQIRQFH